MCCVEMNSMSRKCALVLKRKQDLNSKLKDLTEESKSVVEYVESIIKRGTSLATDLERETDNVIFLGRFPVVIKELDSLVNKLIQLNCTIGVGTSDDEAEEGAQNNAGFTEQTFIKSPVHSYEQLTPENLIHSSAFHNVGNRSELMQLNCDFGLCASGEAEAEEEAHNEQCVTEQTCTKPAVHTCEQLAAENATPLSDARDVDRSVNDDSSVLETARSTPSKNALSSCTVQQGTILDMRFLHGDSPYNFWLSYYASKSRDILNETLLFRHRNKQLRPFSMSLTYIGTYVCAFDGSKYFRGKVMKINFGKSVELTVLDVDSGRTRKIKQDRIFELDEDLLDIPAQALNCCLQGDLGDPSLWNDQVTPLFCKVLTESTLVVTICGKNEINPPQFLVEIECHNDLRINSRIELNSWIFYSVLPKLEEMKENTKDERILKPLFTYLDPVTIDEEECTEKMYLESIKKDSPVSTQISNSAVSCPATLATGHSEHHNKGKRDPAPVQCMQHISQPSHVSEPATSPLNMNLPTNSEMTSEFNSCSPQMVHDHGGSNDGSLCVNKNITRESTLHLSEEKNIFLHEAVHLSSVEQQYEAMLAHIEDPGEFYIHTVCEDNKEIDNLQNKMTDYYRTACISFKSKEEAKFCVGLFCAAIYNADEKWYRAKVIDWNEDNDSDQVSIQYVDYGNMALVHFSMLQPMRSEFVDLPVCATKCSLAMIHPTTSAHDKISESWSEEAASVFKCLVNMQSVYSVILAEPRDDSNDSLPVFLQECENDSSTINELMVELGYAVKLSPTDNPVSIGHDPKTIESSKEGVPPVSDVPNQAAKDVASVWGPMHEEYYAEFNTLYHDDEDSCYVVTGYKAQDERRVCKFFAKEGWCFKGETCQKEHTYLNPDGWTTDRDKMLQNEFSKVVLPDVQDEILIQVTHITQVNLFYAVICAEHQSCNRIKVKRVDAEEEDDDDDDEREETLKTLNDYMNEAHNVKAMKRHTVMPADGQIVLARFSKDGRFYRARVVDCTDQQLQVFYVDYGNKEWVNDCDVRAIEPKYLHLPFQAIECVLANVNDVRESTEAHEFLAKLVYNKTLQAQVISQVDSVPRLEILLWDENGHDVGQLIVHNDYGSARMFGVHDCYQKDLTTF